MYKKLIASGVTASTLLLGTVTPITHAESNETTQEQPNQVSQEAIDQAKERNDESVKGNKDNELKDPVYAEGSDLDSSQKSKTKELLGVDDGTKTYDVTTSDVQSYTGGTYDFIKSSAIIEPKKLKKGVDVEIVTPDNITRITKEQYINASITSGIKDADIKIASVEPVTGEGALAGIYESLEKEGFNVDKVDAQSANQELNDLSSIKEEQKNSGNDDYSDKAMNNAVADMKGQVADKKHDKEDLTENDIKQIVDDTLKEKGMDKQLTNDQKVKIENIVINASDSKAMNDDPKSFKDQSDKLKNKLSDSVDKVKEEAGENKGFFKSLWDKITGWF